MEVVQSEFQIFLTLLFLTYFIYIAWSERTYMITMPLGRHSGVIFVANGFLVYDDIMGSLILQIFADLTIMTSMAPR